MNKQMNGNEWSELKAKIKTKWQKFSDNEVEGFKNDLSRVSGQIQKTYGVAKEQADREFKDFKATLDDLGQREHSDDSEQPERSVN